MPKKKPKPKAKPPAPNKPAPAPKKPVAKPSGPQLRAIRSVIYQVTDLARAKAYYGALLGRTPYFDQPFYAGYDIDGQELGLHPDTSRIQPGPGGAIAYWRVDDLYAAWEHALSNGGEPVEPPHNVGEGTDTAIVADPFGNYVGLIQIS
jgi:predicted enzyme related to lactoylglutathione lyase